MICASATQVEEAEKTKMKIAQQIGTNKIDLRTLLNDKEEDYCTKEVEIEKLMKADMKKNHQVKFVQGMRFQEKQSWKIKDNC